MLTAIHPKGPAAVRKNQIKPHAFGQTPYRCQPITKIIFNHLIILAIFSMLNPTP
jgi:hypothetical protein